MTTVHPLRPDERGMMLLEALVAMLIVAVVTITYIGIRTTALIDATRARNWRLAREIADEKMSELKAGAHEVPPESGIRVPIDRYEGFAYMIALGESAVADAEGQVAEESAGDAAGGLATKGVYRVAFDEYGFSADQIIALQLEQDPEFVWTLSLRGLTGEIETTESVDGEIARPQRVGEGAFQ